MDPIDTLTLLRSKQQKGEKWTGIDVMKAKIGNEKVILVSSKTGENIKELKELIQNIIIKQNPYKYKKNEMKGDVGTFGN